MNQHCCLLLALVISLPVKALDCVILLHGLARTDASMTSLTNALERTQFTAVNYRYSSTEHAINKLADDAINGGLAQCPPDSKQIHFVTHSMGGIMVRQYLSQKPIEKLGRVVMLGPPNKGSQVVDHLGEIPGFQWFNGPAGMQLGTGEFSVPNNLGPANFELGIIAGSRSINLFLSTLLPSQDDGKVTVENTRLDGMADHITLPVTHPFMMKNTAVIKQVIYFLRHGAFSRPGIISRSDYSTVTDLARFLG